MSYIRAFECETTTTFTLENLESRRVTSTSTVFLSSDGFGWIKCNNQFILPTSGIKPESSKSRKSFLDQGWQKNISKDVLKKLIFDVLNACHNARVLQTELSEEHGRNLSIVEFSSTVSLDQQKSVNWLLVCER